MDEAVSPLSPWPGFDLQFVKYLYLRTLLNCSNDNPGLNNPARILATIEKQRTGSEEGTWYVISIFSCAFALTRDLGAALRVSRADPPYALYSRIKGKMDTCTALSGSKNRIIQV